MRRGTTPTITFTLPDSINIASIDKLSIVFKQGDEIIIEKGLTDSSMGQHTITISLSESETLKMNSIKNLYIQMRCGIGDQRLASNIVTTNADEILKGGLL